MDSATDIKRLQGIIVTLSARAGLEPPAIVYDELTWAPTASLQRAPHAPAKLLVTGGLLAALAGEADPDAALAAVLAHELGHLAARDLHRQRRLARLAVHTIWASLCLIPAGLLLGDLRTGGLIIGFASLAAVAFLLLRRGDRQIEITADAYAAALVGSPVTLAGALLAHERYRFLSLRHVKTALRLEFEHLSPGPERVPDGSNLAALRDHTRLVFGLPLSAPRLAAEVETLEALLFTAPKYPTTSRRSWRETLLATHPSTESRVRRLQQMT